LRAKFVAGVAVHDRFGPTWRLATPLAGRADP
jgi:hypothetical protein